MKLRLPHLVALLLVGCVRGEESVRLPADGVGSRTEDLPSLVRVVQPEPIGLASSEPPWSIAVSKQGEVAFPAGRGEESQFVVVDSLGSFVATFGQHGEGPHEVIGHGGILFGGDSTLVLVDPETRQTLVFGFDGKPSLDRRNLDAYFPIARDDESLLINRGFTDHGASRVERVSISNRTAEVVIPQDDSLLRLLGLTARGPWPAAAWDGSRIVLGEGNSYTLVLYEPDQPPVQFGPSHPPRHRTALELDQATSELTARAREPFIGPYGKAIRTPDPDARIRKLKFDTLPHFTAAGGLAFDAQGRLWVVGQASDSTFADVYADTTFLGRITVDYFNPYWTRPVALQSRWLAVPCLESDDVYRIRLYRIEG